MNPYGVTGQYQTPNEQTASYYGNGNPYGSYAKPGWFGSANQLFSPFYRDSMSGNPTENSYDAAGVMGSKPFDAAAWVGQRIAAPALAMGLASAYGSSAAGRFGGSLVGGMAQGMGAKAGGMVARGAGMVGYGAGYMLGPIAMGLAASEMVNQSIFQPYVRSRQMAEEMHRNFRGITFSDAGGNIGSGRGLSFGESSRLGIGVERQAWRDRGFSNNEYQGIASMGMRAGLFDDTQSNQILERVRSVASQVKMLMAISKDLTTQSAIEELSRLRMGGAGVAGGVYSQAARAYSGIGMNASIAGMSTTAMMNTAGTIGAGMYQSQGMTPYLGAMAASTSMAGFAVAERLGILSSAHLSRLGGLQGASQSSIAGQMTAAGTPYAAMSMYNATFGRGDRGNITGNVLGFAQSAAADPLGTAGRMSLYGNQMAEGHMKKYGSRSAEMQAIQYLQATHQKPTGAGGKYSPEQMHMVYTGVMGMSKDAAIAYQSQRSAETDPGMMGASLKAINAQTYEQLDAAMSADSSYPTLLGAAGRLYKNTVSKVGSTLSENFSDPFVSMGAELSDMTSHFYQSLKGDFTGNSGPSVNFGAISKARGPGAKSGFTGSESALYRDLNRAARQPGERGELARSILNSKLSTPDAKQKLAKFAKESTDPLSARAYREIQSSNDLFDRMKQAFSIEGAINGDPADATNHPGLDSLKIMGQAQDIIRASSQMGGGVLRDNLGDLLKDPRYSELAGTLGGVGENTRASMVEAMANSSYKQGYRGSAEMARMGASIEQIKKANGGSVKGRYVVSEGDSEEGARRIDAILLSSAEKSLEQVRAAESGVDNSMYLAATRSMEAANLFYDGAKLFYAGATKQDVNLVTGLSGQSTVNLAKPNTR